MNPAFLLLQSLIDLQTASTVAVRMVTDSLTADQTITDGDIIRCLESVQVAIGVLHQILNPEPDEIQLKSPVDTGVTPVFTVITGGVA